MIKTFIKPMIYNKNRLESAEQIAAGTYKNFDYYVLNLHTHPTAYVDVTDSPLNEVFYVDIDISCHGGFTYSASTLKTVDKKGWFIGWDYAHYGDYVCGAETYLNYYDKKWTTEEIVEECKNVINKIVAKYYKETKKMKYKVGDKVRIVSEWGKGCCQSPTGKMDKWLGKVMTVRDVGITLYRMVEDIEDNEWGGWVWTENCIAGFACEKKIVITTDEVETLASLYDGNKVIKTATAKCSPDDKFSFETGAKIAFERLLDSKEKEEPKYFNGKAVCVDGYLGFTVGKIYEFVNGQCFDDQNVLRPLYRKCKDLSFYGSTCRTR